MIEGGWAYIWAAYAVALGALAALALVVTSRLAHWARAARALTEREKR
jgi:hypothetical protein